jgi:formate-dependent nitrite reductase membrane component NrfD
VADIHEINDPPDVFSQLTPVYDMQKAASPVGTGQAGYYGLPILKRPVWRWEVATYFFLEGVSASAYTLATIADLTCKRKCSSLVRSARLLAFVTMLACPPLLIADLGRPERFHHMFRLLYKKTSPMNHGAWALNGFGFGTTMLAFRMIPESKLPFGKRLFRLMLRILPDRLVAILGLPFALMMISYPGVLLETTSNPVWSHTNFLGPLLASSSMSTGAAALALLTARSDDEKTHGALMRMEDVSAAAEAAALLAYIASAGPAARPLTHGKQSGLFLFGAIGMGIVVPALLRRSRSKALRSVVAPLFTLAGGFALKWAITYAGHESALDAKLANRNAPSKTGEPFWGQGRSADLKSFDEEGSSSEAEILDDPARA